MPRFNIFRNKLADVQVKYLMDNFDSAIAKQTEQYWREKISEEIYNSCSSVRRGGYPCEECYDFYEFVLYKKQTDHDR